jgi:hypothetical protein
MLPRERYMFDPEFHSIVDMLESMLHKTQFTPTELREAVMLAAIKYEGKTIKPLYQENPDGSVTVWDRNFTG